MYLFLKQTSEHVFGKQMIQKPDPQRSTTSIKGRAA